MPNVAFASDYRFVPPSQLAQFGPAAEAMFREVCSGEQPLIPKDRQHAFIGAALDEIGRGTHPSKIKERLLKCLKNREEVSRAA